MKFYCKIFLNKVENNGKNVTIIFWDNFGTKSASLKGHFFFSNIKILIGVPTKKVTISSTVKF